jgi:hypothetical protein
MESLALHLLAGGIAMSLFPQISNDPKVAARMVDAEAEANRRAGEMGKVGVWLGNRDHQATFFAGVMAIVLLVFMATVAFGPLGSGLDRTDTLKSIGAFFLGTLGFLFGSLKGGHKD